MTAHTLEFMEFIDSEPGASIEEYFNAKDIRILK